MYTSSSYLYVKLQYSCTMPTYQPVPVEKVQIEHNSTKYQSRLDEQPLSVLLLSREEDHLRRSNFFTRQVLDVT